MAKNEKSLSFNWVTPALPAYFPELASPKAFRDPDTGVDGPAKYSCGLLLDDKAYRDIKKHLDASIEKLGLDPEDIVNLPLGRSKKDKTIRFLKGAAGEDKKPMVFDAKNNKVPDEVVKKIGGGSLVKLGLTFKAYPTLKRLACYLNAVQLIRLEEYTPRSENPFEATDGFEVSESEKSPFAEAEKPSWDAAGDKMHDF